MEPAEIEIAAHFHYGKWGFNPPRVPTFGISWYKYGGILQGARIIGSLGDKYIGAGEAGPEAVLPLHSFYSELRNIIAELVDRNAGPTEFNQYNSYYSPKDLSPAECARKTRDETRQLLKNVKRAYQRRKPRRNSGPFAAAEYSGRQRHSWDTYCPDKQRR